MAPNPPAGNDGPALGDDHPGYATDAPLLDFPLKTPPDGLCLANCFLAATDYAFYSSLCVDDAGFLRGAQERTMQSRVVAYRDAVIAHMGGCLYGPGSSPAYAWLCRLSK